MGKLIDGKWHDVWYDTAETKGKFVRKAASFRNRISKDGTGQFQAEKDRYHLYVSLACPWAHRTLIMRSLKGLEEIIPVSVVHWYMAENGWTFDEGPGVKADPIHNAKFMHQIYTAAKSDYTGRVTVPVLWDKKTNTIVNNESSEIIRDFTQAFDDLEGVKPGDYYPEALRAEIDDVNDRIYDTLNNGVYKCGFATTQEAYDAAIGPLFETMDWLEERLSQNRYLVGDQLTEADIRLFTTLVRFDPVYVGHFKCNLKRVEDYPNLIGFVRDIYQTANIADTVNFEHIKKHYYQSHDTINPTRIVPAGPEFDYTLPHNRG